MLFVIRKRESDVMGQSLALNSSRPRHAPAPSSLRGFQCAAHMTQATDLSPLPLIPILLYTPILPMCTNFSPSVSSPSSFLHLFHLLPLSFSAYPHVSGSEADASQALTYLCLSPKQPEASRQWYVAGHAHQTPGLRVNWETGCLAILATEVLNYEWVAPTKINSI